MVMHMMRSNGLHTRRATAGFALALFLAGSNYCLVGTVAGALGHGARVSCMALATPACHAAPRADHCAKAQAPAQNDPAPVRTGTAPCCVALAPVLAMPAVKILASDFALALPVAPATDDPAPLSASWHGHRVFRDAGPPPLHLRAPVSPRAPPLA